MSNLNGWGLTARLITKHFGALGNRVIDGINGRKFRPGDINDLAEVINWFIETESWRTWRLPTPRIAYDLAADHDALYRSLQNRTG